jgi:tetratricopeptide (TPR) repeat protein
MNLRQEQVVFLVVAAILGFMVYGELGSDAPSSRSRRRSSANAQAMETESFPAPDISLVTAPDRDPRSLNRSLFEPPRDTRPLPLLMFSMPPRPALPGLIPTTEPGPAPKLFGDLLRRPASPVDRTGGLFDETGAAEGAADEFDTLEDPFAEPESADDGEDLPLDTDLFTADEIAERIASYQKLYDWIRLESLRFGHIQNKDRFSLEAHPNEPIEFMELDMATGKPRYPGQGSISFDRDRVEEFAFAQTVSNEIELKRLQFAGELRHGQYVDVLAFADWCVSQRLETPRALEVAEEMYTSAVTVSDGEPEPRLGLARCYEAGFRFEEAFAVYAELLEGGLDTHPAVLARLGSLERRFRMFERARDHLMEAERYGRTSWEAQWGLGSFLLDQGEEESANAHLELAARFEPTAPDLKQTRARIRYDYGRGLTAAGRLREAKNWFSKSVQADPSFAAGDAGSMACALLMGEADELEVSRTSTFEGLLNSGLAAAMDGDWTSAKDQLLLAASADPMRAGEAWRALSWVADRTGYPEEALRFIELAYENDPTDVWTLYHRGRVLAERDDLQGAQESLQAALDQELMLSDALALLGDLAFRQENHEAAERYLERAVMLDGEVAAFHELRGMNLLRLGRVLDARDSLELALELDRSRTAARSSLAWTFYASGNSEEAITRLRELDDQLRDRPEEDPERVYAQGQISRIVQHEEKVAWTDRFERRELRNGWVTDENAGPLVRMADGGVMIGGSFSKRGRARVFREELAGNFVSFESTVTIEPGALCRVGVFVSRERSRRGALDVQNEVAVARHHDGTLQTRVLKRTEGEQEWTDVPVVTWETGLPTTLRIERHGESTKTTFRLLVDGVPVADGLRVPGIGATTEQLRFGVFVEGEPGRSANVRVDDVEFIYKDRG